MLTFIILIIFGVLAGIVSTVTGMGSLVSYPVLLATGLPPIVANVTQTAAQAFSGFGAAASSRRELKANLRDLYWIMPVALFGSLVGSILLLIFPSSVFEKVIPFMVLFVAIFMLIQPHLPQKNRQEIKENARISRSPLMLAGVLGIGLYSGYFGAAAGVFMLVLFTLNRGISLLTSNALKNVTLGSTNLLATIIYAFFGHINWPYALMMGIGYIVGGYVGPVIARHLPQKLLRYIIILGAFILGISLFVEAYL